MVWGHVWPFRGKSKASLGDIDKFPLVSENSFIIFYGSDFKLKLEVMAGGISSFFWGYVINF
jgi:hypothetical protein